jgi:hypothetical protein
MSCRSVALATAVAVLSSIHIAGAAAQSVYVAPGGIYIGAGAGPVYVTPSVPTNGPAAAAYVGPGYGYGTAANFDPGYDDGYGPVGYVEPDGYGYGPAPYVERRYGYRYEPGAYVAPRYGYGYGPSVPNRRYYSGPRSAYATALPPRPRVAVPYGTGRCVGRYGYGRHHCH